MSDDDGGGPAPPFELPSTRRERRRRALSSSSSSEFELGGGAAAGGSDDEDAPVVTRQMLLGARTSSAEAFFDAAAQLRDEPPSARASQATDGTPRQSRSSAPAAAHGFGSPALEAEARAHPGCARAAECLCFVRPALTHSTRHCAAQSPQVAELLAAKLGEARRAAALDTRSATEAYERGLSDERQRAATLAKRVQARCCCGAACARAASGCDAALGRAARACAFQTPGARASRSGAIDAAFALGGRAAQ